MTDEKNLPRSVLLRMIGDLRQQLRTAEATMATLAAEPTLAPGTMRFGGYVEGERQLPAEATVTFQLEGQERHRGGIRANIVDTGAGKLVLELHGGDVLAVLPRSSNVVWLEVRR